MSDMAFWALTSAAVVAWVMVWLPLSYFFIEAGTPARVVLMRAHLAGGLGYLSDGVVCLRHEHPGMAVGPVLAAVYCFYGAWSQWVIRRTTNL